MFPDVVHSEHFRVVTPTGVNSENRSRRDDETVIDEVGHDDPQWLGLGRCAHDGSPTAVRCEVTTCGPLQHF